ncbi:MAG: TraX family protein [Tissierellaceae bacterium]
MEGRYNIQPKKGLTGFQLKIIAMVLMTFDHIHAYLNYNQNIPIQFRWMGRLVAPLFIFMTVEGYHFTRSRKRYMFRLYTAYVIMAIGNNLLDRFLPRPDGVIISSSMFGTLFLVVVYLSIVDFLRKAFIEKKILKMLLGIVFLLTPIFFSFIIIMNLNNISLLFFRILVTLIPMPLFVEGNIVFIAIGIILYLFRSNKNKQIISYILISVVFLISSRDFSIQGLLYKNYQWMMIFAAPLMYLYNGTKGRDIKYLFYIFYPTHIYLFHMISYYMLTR